MSTEAPIELPEALTAAEELKSLALIVKRVEKLSPASKAWLVARLEVDGQNGNGAGA